MEIKNLPSPEPNGRRAPASENGIDLTRPNREGIQRVVEDLESQRAAELAARRGTNVVAAAVNARQEHDRIDLSEQARVLARSHDEDGEDGAAQRARIATLRADYLEGRVNTPERIQRTASKILGGP